MQDADQIISRSKFYLIRRAWHPHRLPSSYQAYVRCLAAEHTIWWGLWAQYVTSLPQHVGQHRSQASSKRKVGLQNFYQMHMHDNTMPEEEGREKGADQIKTGSNAEALRILGTPHQACLDFI
jgi:hypothetical protein